MILVAQTTDRRPVAYASWGMHAFDMTKPSRADARRVTPEACLWHDAIEGHEGEAFVRLA
jgi:hypothetical protein